MHATSLRIGDGFLAGNPDRVLLYLNLQCLFFDARQFDDGKDILPLLKDVNRGEGTLARCLVLKPVAGLTRLERSLDVDKRFKRISEGSDHCCTYLHLLGAIWTQFAHAAIDLGVGFGTVKGRVPTRPSLI